MTHGASIDRGWTGRLSCLQALLCACALALAACPPTEPPGPEGDDDDVSGDDPDSGVCSTCGLFGWMCGLAAHGEPPAILALLVAALGGLGLVRRRRSLSDAD